MGKQRNAREGKLREGKEIEDKGRQDKGRQDKGRQDKFSRNLLNFVLIIVAILKFRGEVLWKITLWKRFLECASDMMNTLLNLKIMFSFRFFCRSDKKDLQIV